MEAVAEFAMLPLAGQIVVGDPASGDIPQWETGTESAVFNSQLVAVACRSDFDGPVACRVWRSVEPPVWDDVVFDGELLTTGPQMVVGSLLSGDLVAVEVGRGWHRLLVRATPSGAAAELDVVLVTGDSESADEQSAD